MTSSKECLTDGDCATNLCKSAESGSTTRFCQTSTLPEHMAACLMEKIAPVVPKAMAILKDVLAGGDQTASNEKIGQGLALIAGREQCSGPDGWNFNPEWRSCKTYDETNWDCLEYYCEDREDCKEKCTNSPPICNSDPWSSTKTEETCADGTMDNKFCAMCWGGDSDCHEVSEASICRLGISINDAENPFTDEDCTALLGDGAREATDRHYDPSWGGWRPSYCEKDATTESECVDVSLCDAAGYHDQ